MGWGGRGGVGLEVPTAVRALAVVTIGRWVFHERLTPLMIGGIVLICAGVLLIESAAGYASGGCQGSAASFRSMMTGAWRLARIAL